MEMERERERVVGGALPIQPWCLFFNVLPSLLRVRVCVQCAPFFSG